MSDYIIIYLAVIGLAGFAAQWISWWLKIPAILFLLVFGIILGPELHWLNPDALFGNLLIPMVQLSVAIILFEGSLSLNFDEWGEVASVVRNLVTVGLIITAVTSALFCYWIFGLNYKICALFGAIITVSGPTVIVPILRTIRPKQKISNILRWEAILIDPIGAILAVLTLGFILALHNGVNYYHVVGHFVEMIVVASVVGIVAGYWLGISLRRHWFPEYLQNIATLTIVIAAYTASNLVDEGSGLLSVTLMGIFITNMKDVNIESILDFKENLSILLISGIFIILAARINFHSLHSYILEAVSLFLALQFVVRPLSIAVCTLRSGLSLKEKILLAWICPRGIVAAAVAALFTIRLEAEGIAGANRLVMITFLMIIGTVIFQSLTARTLARLLKVSEPEPKGFLIIGANPVARMIAKALNAEGFRAQVSSMVWSQIKEARMDGLKAYYGNPISEHADRHLDLIGIGNMLAIAPQADLNTLASLRYRGEFGRNHIYAIQTKASSEKVLNASRFRGSELFAKETTFTKLASLIAQGATISKTLLTKNFDFKSYQVKHQGNAIPLFALDPKGRIHFFTPNEPLEPKADWHVISLIAKATES